MFDTSELEKRLPKSTSHRELKKPASKVSFDDEIQIKRVLTPVDKKKWQAAPLLKYFKDRVLSK